MKKYFTSFVAAGTVASFAAACHKKAKPKATTTDKKDTKKTEAKEAAPASTLKKGKAKTGTFKVGVTGLKLGTFNKADRKTDGTSLKGKELFEIVKKYTQDVKDSADTGKAFFDLPSGLSLKSSSEFNVDGGASPTPTSAQKKKAKEALSDKTKLAAKNLDALFVAVTDDVQNNEDVYKTVVEKKEFKNTHLFFIGDKAKSQSGSSSKTFAGGTVSTASFDVYAATYVAGFQAAAGALKYSTSEDEFIETNVVFLIGAITDSEAKRKAFAFRRGVEAAKKHPAYSKYLKVKFVSKTEDTSKSSKKLVRDVSDWKEKSDGKSKLYEFTTSDTFSDAERRVVYIAGTTAEQWTGKTKVGDVHSDQKDVFWKGDDLGLIGALYNAKDPSAKAGETGDSFDSLTDKTYSRNVWIVLDKAYGLPWTKGTDWDDYQNKDTGKKGTTTAEQSKTLSSKHNLTQVYEGSTANEQVGLTFERRDVRFYGAVGSKSTGTEVYTEQALKALFMGGVNYMVGKHTIFGAPLDVSFTTFAGDTLGVDMWNKFEADDKNQPWLLPKEGASKDKNKGRFHDSLSYALERELSKDALVKESAWLK